MNSAHQSEAETKQEVLQNLERNLKNAKPSAETQNDTSEIHTREDLIRGLLRH